MSIYTKNNQTNPPFVTGITILGFKIKSLGEPTFILIRFYF